LVAYPAFNPDGPQDESDMPQALINFTADGAPPCNLDGQLVTHLRLKLGDTMNHGDVCAMQVTLYEKGAQDEPELLAWGSFTSERFIPDKGIFLPCPAARKAAQAAASSAAASSAAKGPGP
jgi:hypothetical protein